VIQGEDLVRFPVQFVEALCNLLIFAVLSCYKSRFCTENHSIEIYLSSYAVCRFVLEFFRDDSVRGIWIWGLSTAQIISLCILAGIAGEIVFKLWKVRNQGTISEKVSENEA
jgi:phosphatidylglycerol:prolipoprotein diacylglycerol transferase